MQPASNAGALTVPPEEISRESFNCTPEPGGFDADLVERPPMVGRERDLETLKGHLDDAIAGRGSLVLIAGEAGIGKTRLIEELQEIAGERGFLVLRGHAIYESMTPYMPFFEALKSGGLDYLSAEETPRVEGAYIVTHTGLLVREVVREQTELDPNLFASMLATVAGFVEDSFAMLKGTRSAGSLDRLSHGDFMILVERGRSADLAVVLTGRENEFLVGDMREALRKVDREYGTTLAGWDGDDETVAGMERLLDPLVTSGKYDGVYSGKEDPQARRNLLFESVALGLARHASEKPTLLCIEDLQWADPSTLALLHYVARNMRAHGLLAMGTYRPEDLVTKGGGPHTLIDAIQRMDGEDILVQIELHRLSASDTAKVVTGLLGGGELGEDLARRVQEETAGNPLFLVETVRLLVDERGLRLDNGVWSASGNPQEVGIPRKVQGIIQRRLGRVGDAERQVLDIAAVIGEEFTSEVVGSSLGIDPTQLLRDLRSLERSHRLIRSREGRYRFDHVKIKETLYGDLPPEFQTWYHGRVAAAMEAQGSDSIEDRAGEIAFHYYHSGERTRALPYLLKAADRAAKQYANAEAIRFYVEALELEEDAEKREEILVGLGSTYRLIGEYGNALESYELALDLAVGEKKSEILTKMAETHFRKGDLEQSMKCSLEALTIVSGKENKAEAEALTQLGRVQWCQGEYAGSLEHHAKALGILEKIGDRQAMAFSLNNIGIVHYQRGDYDAALEHHRKGLEIREKIGDQHGIAISLSNSGNVHLQRGDYDAALKHYAKAVEMFGKIGDRQAMGITLNNLGDAHAVRGDYDAALKHYTRGLEIQEKVGDLRGIAISLNNLGNVHLQRGDHDSALEHLEKSLAISRSIGSRDEEGNALCLLADVKFGKGEFQKATDLCDEALSLSTAMGARRTIAKSTKTLGAIFRERKMWPESIENFERSLHTYEEIHQPLGQADSCFEFGVMWKEKGNATEAVKYLGRAIDLFEKLGTKQEIAKARAAYETITPSPDPDSRAERSMKS